MKPSPITREHGAALILTLVLVTVIALVVVSLFAVSRQETSLSGAAAATVRAQLAEEAAFADASARILSLTAADGYLVTLARMENTGAGPTRHTFITTADAGGLTHHPLFAGGREQRTALPDFDGTDTAVLADTAIAAPTVVFDGDTRTGAILLPRLSGLDDEGNVVVENPRPEAGFVELPADDSPWRTRYTFWIEDLEGYPNTDVIGLPADPHPGAAIRPGYAAHDHRARSPSAVFAMEGTTETPYHFPTGHRGQSLVDQVAPGLSPREIILHDWAIPGGFHPYRDAMRFPGERHWFSGTRHGTIGRQDHEPGRFASGLRPYLAVPFIPYGHGYADEGKPRFNLNTLVANRDLGIADIVERNLPAFKERRGGFPEDEDYTATLAANAIDYADGDSLPSLPANTVNAGTRVFRGVDSYCPVNEFFLKFEYVGYENAGANHLVTFEATPFVEFWNPSNREAKMESVRLRFRFLERIRFRANSDWHDILESHRVLDEAFPDQGGLTVTVPPNHYEVVRFGRIRWKVPVATDPIYAFPIVSRLEAASGGSSVNANYEFFLGDGLVDQCGRLDPAEPSTTPKHGFYFSKHTGTILPGDFIMRMTLPNVVRNRELRIGGHFGDPWMPWYSRSTSDLNDDRSDRGQAEDYLRRATPGFRNVDHHRVITTRKDRMRDQARVRDWPDRGYDSPHHSSTAPDSNAELPDSFNTTHDPKLEAFAPWRISNLGRFHSVTELGNLHDPVLWIPQPEAGVPFSATSPTTHLYGTLRDGPLKSLPEIKTPEERVSAIESSKMWGGGNTLRIGRPEHARFDQPGMRASQWLDLFHAGSNGTNLGPLPGSGVTAADLYRHHDPRDHQPPPTAPDPVRSRNEPYSLLYDPGLNAQGRYSLVHGHLNLNTAPTRFEIETLLRGPFVSCDLRLRTDHFKSPVYTRDGEGGPLRSGLREESIPLIARGLMEARPFYSPSHFARVLSELIDRHDALPDHHNDAEAEETFARIFNTTTLSSRHFRIHTAAEVYHATTGEVVGRSRRVREVFSRPARDADGRILRTDLEILSNREP